ncbi:MAG TPA: hypothetical protein VE996_03255 [Terriglobales bacterium]|nr:hypothetical protein [Terriglobales bacterium]
MESVIHDHRVGSVLVGALLLAVAIDGLIGPIAKRPPSLATTVITGIFFAIFVWSGSVARGAERIVFLLAAVAMAVPLVTGRYRATVGCSRLHRRFRRRFSLTRGHCWRHRRTSDRRVPAAFRERGR